MIYDPEQSISSERFRNSVPAHQRRYYVYNQTVIHPWQHLSHRAVCPFYGKPDADHVRYYPVHSISSFYGNPFSRLDPEHLYRYCRTGSFPAAGPAGDFLYPSLVFHPIHKSIFILKNFSAESNEIFSKTFDNE